MMTRKPNIPWICGVAGMLVALALAAGCASSGYQKANITAAGLQTASAEVQAEQRSLELTMAALDEMLTNPAPDLRTQFANYSSALDKFQSAARRTEATGKRNAQKSAAYLRAWDEELARMNYDAVRNTSQTRRDEVRERLNALDRRYQEAQDVVAPLIDYLNDTRRALRADLTSDGLHSVRPIIRNADDNASKVYSALTRLTQDLDDSGAKLASFSAPK